MLLYKLNIHTKYLRTQKVKIVLNEAKILQIITFFSEKFSQKVHKLLDENIKNHSVNRAAKLGGRWVKTAFFHRCQVIWHAWKIVVSQICLAKFCCITGNNFFKFV